MDIDWTALVKVAVVSFAFSIGIVTVYSLGIVGLASGAAGEGDSPSSGSAPASRTRITGLLLSGLCFALCAAAVLYGLWLIIPQFHD